MTHRTRATGEFERIRRDRQGIALPIALFGLLAMTVMIGSALVTSTTELAISRAHREAMRSLFGADAAIERLVAERAILAEADQRLADGTHALEVDGRRYDVVVVEIFRSQPEEAPHGGLERYETFSLVAEPFSGRGRSVGAMMEARRTAEPVSLNIDAALTSGSSLTIGAGATVTSGSEGEGSCGGAGAPVAIRHSADPEHGSPEIEGMVVGPIESDERSPGELMHHVLGETSLERIEELAGIRFGPRFGRPVFQAGRRPGQSASDVEYRWGCPARLVVGCTAEQSGHYPTVVVDAAGGVVDIRGDHGQGILLVRNGGLHLGGDFRFQGIIIVEGSLNVTEAPILQGAVIALGGESSIGTGSGRESGGAALIIHDRCEIDSAQRGLTLLALESAAQNLDSSTFGWFEVIR
jgi:hypothetical protein